MVLTNQLARLCDVNLAILKYILIYTPGRRRYVVIAHTKKSDKVSINPSAGKLAKKDNRLPHLNQNTLHSAPLCNMTIASTPAKEVKNSPKCGRVT